MDENIRSSSRSRSRSEENVVLIFPFMAQGHIIPFLALALQIERKKKDDFSIIFINTPLNIKKLRSSLPPTSSIRLLEIPFSSSDHGLPPDSENTDVLPYAYVIRLLEASSSLASPFRKILEDLILAGRKPLCVIADIFFGWTVGVSKELGIFHALFSGCSGFGLACYCSLWLNLPHRKNGGYENEFSLPDFEEAKKIHLSQLPLNIYEANGEDSWSKFQNRNLNSWFDSNGILFNTVGGFDQLGLMYFERKFGRPVWPIGPILLSSERRASVGKLNGVASEVCIEWLNSKPSNSVLYVSFGSMNTISPTQMIELATALDKSNKNFIWVVRPPIGFDINSEFKAEKWLPEGFEERVLGRGLLVKNWAPQVEILSHKAVSAFLSHCGWNSALEALSNGVPMLAWPMAAEQFFNAVLLEREVGVCVEVARGKKCEVRHQDLVEKIELVMATEKGSEMRRKACELREMIENAVKDDDDDDDDQKGGVYKGSSSKALDDFFSAAMNMT